MTVYYPTDDFTLWNKLKSPGQVSPFTTYNLDISLTFLMLHKAVSLMPKLFLEPAHHEPENPEYLEQSEAAEKEIRRLAGEIYKSLTGEEVTATLKQ